MCEGVFNVDNSHLWAYNNPHAIHKGGYQVCFSVSIWAGIVGDIVVAPCLLRYRLTAEQYHEFLETVLPELLEDVPLVVKKRLWFRHDGTPARSTRKVDCTLRVDCMASIVTRSDCDGLFLWEHQKKHIYAVPPKTTEGLMARH
jgi:hypothetical protein